MPEKWRRGFIAGLMGIWGLVLAGCAWSWVAGAAGRDIPVYFVSDDGTPVGVTSFKSFDGSPSSLPAWWGVALVGVLLACWVMERWLRRRFLPVEGRAAWCFRTMVAAVLFVLAVCLLVDKCRFAIPGFISRTMVGTCGLAPVSVTMESTTDLDNQAMNVGISEEFRSVAIPLSDAWNGERPREYLAHRVRIHPVARPDLPGWVVSRDDRMFRKEGSADVFPLDAEGLLAVFRDVARPQQAGEPDIVFVQKLDDVCARWGRVPGKPDERFVGFISRWSGPIGWTSTGAVRETTDIRPVWFLPAVCGVMFVLVGATLLFTARATMGART